MGYAKQGYVGVVLETSNLLSPGSVGIRKVPFQIFDGIS